ncbi:hypothetical protein WR25_24473 [Diploscapter pachys]|uniref:G-protein coupled receptors family 1 profile domain-containing protein n=1 Tax=Diploscapter pachys TaxID=2018661 RepID=A0A2A2KXL9_9BILA|nr:hypothetical protein WR25_24473 [Diploscapter pachys]
MHEETNFDHSDQNATELYELSPYELTIWCILYTTIALLAIAGNSLVLYVTLFRLRVRTITTYFIINLGLADLLTAVFAIPFKFQAALFQCLPTYAEEDWWKFYNVYLTIMHYFIPMIILDGAYMMIAIKLCTTTTLKTEGRMEQKNIISDVSNRKLMKMLIIVVACFSLCWFPLEIYLLLNELKPEVNKWKYINITFFCAHWLAMSNSCINVFIYGKFNRKYNYEFRRIFRIIKYRENPEKDDRTSKSILEESNDRKIIENSWPTTKSKYRNNENAPFHSETLQAVLSDSQQEEIDHLNQKIVDI